MISPVEAIELLKNITIPFRTEKLPLAKTLGMNIAEKIVADRDFPPFDRAMMDGIAVKDIAAPTWKIEGMLFAGEPVKAIKKMDGSLEIMTGATAPRGTEAIIKIEDLSIEKKIATYIGKTPLEKGQFIHLQGADAPAGSVLVKKRTKIGPVEIAIAATVGKAHIEVESKPHVHIFSTGDEIVGLHETPKDHQIRSSNVMMLKSVLLSKGFKANSSHLPDSAEKIKASIDKVLESNDIILLSGGVSAGKKDLIPSVLAEAGFETVFHKISQKPGKPMLVATRSDGKVVFAFPGNPISTLTCFWVYFLPWVSCDWAEYNVKEIKFLPKPSAELDQWIPVENGEVLAHNGSGDLINWSRADGLVWQKAGDKAKKLPYIPLK
ncbi:molybdopterin molybdotransferase MoeA [Aquirufa lenticrescens]|uniref:molybdopterin molybdotransferase MoeA n=1 Tax=Aquirufa lenticrescens TaxID=2696560 RepID=UPI001CAA52D8|nr:molybdopterin molybdotransferase MoeA [Aquirufa lenticrescens]UAJ14607.1 molybdopterin molybdotransferase MoeA [Aquirufa lenticrescens]